MFYVSNIMFLLRKYGFAPRWLVPVIGSAIQACPSGGKAFATISRVLKSNQLLTRSGGEETS